jgi:hypothetical protein
MLSHAEPQRRREEHTSSVSCDGSVLRRKKCFYSGNQTINLPFRRKAHFFGNELVRDKYFSVFSVSTVVKFVVVVFGTYVNERQVFKDFLRVSAALREAALAAFTETGIVHIERVLMFSIIVRY